MKLFSSHNETTQLISTISAVFTESFVSTFLFFTDDTSCNNQQSPNVFTLISRLPDSNQMPEYLTTTTHDLSTSYCGLSTVLIWIKEDDYS